LTVIERQPGWRFLNLTELWRYRELLWFLVWRDVKVRYKQTVLGAAWAVVQPLATMLVFTVFLGRMAGAASDMATYPLFVFTGLLAWTFFAGAISSSGQSVVANQSLVTKVYFPRLILPMSAVGVGLVDLVIGLGVLGVMMLCYGVAPGWGVLVLPVLTLLLVLAALGVGTLLSALTVAYRDFRHVVPFLVQLWMFATPAIYVQGTFSLGPTWEALLPLNPAQGLIANFRQAMLGGELDLYSAALSGSVGLVLLAAGCLYFRRVEKDFADII
jgi:lipopolysaccharide transport system permease protein